MNKFARQNKAYRKIAQERIEILENLIKNEPENAWNNKYKELITKIQKKYKV